MSPRDPATMLRPAVGDEQAPWTLVYGCDETCPDCGGRGDECDEHGRQIALCDTCDGTGRLAPEATRFACEDASDSLDAAIGGAL